MHKFAILVVLAAAVALSEGLKCWDVDLLKGKSCNAVNSKTVDTRNCVQRDCSAGETCQRISIWVLGQMSTTISGCKSGNNGCNDATSSGFLKSGAITCHCGMDLCNGAGSLSIQATLVTVVVVAAVAAINAVY